MENFKYKQLNKDHKEWLVNRAISENIIDKFNIGSTENGRIAIPVKDSLGKILFYKYRRGPEFTVGPKYTYDKGATVNLFNIEVLFQKPEKVVICEGEFDVMVLESLGIHAVTSTGGATSFQESWVPFFKDLDVYVCMDNDDAGQKGLVKICNFLPDAKYVPLPAEVGDHGDITDFFVKLKKTKKDFEILMSVSEKILIEKKRVVATDKKRVPKKFGTALEQAKKVPLEAFLEFNSHGKARCPFHPDKTPSLQKYKDNTWYCFSCGAGRDVIDLVSKMQEITFQEAIDYLLK